MIQLEGEVIFLTKEELRELKKPRITVGKNTLFIPMNGLGCLQRDDSYVLNRRGRIVKDVLADHD